MAKLEPLTLALAGLLLAQPATMFANTDTCQATTARRILGLARAAGDCLITCHDDVAGGASRRCDAAAPDDALGRCLARAQAKAKKAIRRSCAGESCPACYAGADCAAFTDAQVEAAALVGNPYFDAFYCDDGTSRDGLTDGEANCRESAWREIQRLSRRLLRCRDDADRDACEERTVEKAATALRQACRTHIPECAPLDDESLGTIANLTAGTLVPWSNTIFCVDGCGDGVVDAGEECDPHAVPNGCANGMCDACSCLALCGDGAWNGAETCDETAPPSDDGCGDGFYCTACLFCSPRCGDGLITSNEYATEVCELPAIGCPAGQECLGCAACGTPAATVSATEDLAPCSDTIADRWTFEVEAGAIVRVAVDTLDAATAASLGVEGSCVRGGFRAALGSPCTFPPPDVDPTRSCPATSFVAAASGPCTLTVGVRNLDAGMTACSDEALARYRVSVGGTALTLVADDAAPGLSE